jgi:hypothetical protein
MIYMEPVRHIHRPDMSFYRYTDYEDLASEEIKFVKRVGYRSLCLST